MTTQMRMARVPGIKLLLSSLAALTVSGAGTVARAQTVVVEYYHVDALGSVRAVTDQNRNIVARHDYFPFGEEYLPPAGGDPRRFTGKERDAEIGLDYFGARYYASRTGRFTTVDPALDVDEATIDPQRWNRYAYAGNKPLTSIDRDGLFWEELKNWLTRGGWNKDAAAAKVRFNREVVDARQFFTENDVYLANGKVDPSKLSDQQVMAAWRSFNDEWRRIASLGANPAQVFATVGPPLRLLHSDESLLRSSVDFWRKKPTSEILESLKPGKPESLKVRPDGTVLNGHHRLIVLEERGIDINRLPREVISK